MPPKRQNKQVSQGKRSTGKQAAAKQPASGQASRRQGRRDAQPPVLTGRRLWLFRGVAAIVLPVLFLGTAEIGLRVAGYGYPSAAFIPCKIQSEKAYCNNAQFGWRFFPPRISRAFMPFVFTQDRPENSYRIFVLGASAAQGVPDPAFSFGRMLELMLKETYPGVSFEVIVAAMPAINSHVVREIAKDCAAHDPDLLIVYLGNNEVVGPCGAGTVFAPLSGNLPLIRASLALKATRLGQLTEDLARRIGKTRGPQVWGGLAMFLDKQVPADAPALQTVYSNFQRNLADIVQAGRGAKAPVLLCTVGANLKDCAPFASQHRSTLTDAEKADWERLYEEGMQCEATEDDAQAVALYRQALAIDDRFAALHFRLGRCLWRSGDLEEAKTQFIEARELDTLRFRADLRINDIIRETANDTADTGAELVDIAQMLSDQAGPGGVPGKELFYEHVHLNFHGNYLVARSLCEQVEPLLPASIRERRQADDSILTEQACAERLVYTVWTQGKTLEDLMSSMIEKPPFTNQPYHADQMAEMKATVRTLDKAMTPQVLGRIKSQYQQALQSDFSDWWLHWTYAEFLDDALQEFGPAADQYRQVTDRVPQFYDAYSVLGVAFSKMGRLDDAIALYQKALKLYPYHPMVYFNLGLAYQMKGDLKKAVETYRISSEYEPAFAPPYNNRGIILYQQGRVQEAIDVFLEGLSYVPNDLDLHFNLGIVYYSEGRRTEAIEAWNDALAIDPNSAKTLQILQSAQDDG